VSLGWSAGSLLPATSSQESESQKRPRSPFQSSSHPHQSQTLSRPATAASYCSSSSEVYSSSSSLNNELSQLNVQYNSSSSQPITTQGTHPSHLKHENIPQHRRTSAGNYHASSSEVFSCTLSLDHDLSQLVIQHDEPSPLPLTTADSMDPLQPRLSSTVRNRPTTAGSYHSSSSEVSSSASFLDHHLSQLVIEHDEPASSQSITVQNASSSHQRSPGTHSPRRGTAADYYSSSSEESSSLPDSLDDTFSRRAVEEETPPSSQETMQSTQPSQLKSKGKQPVQCSAASTYDTQPRQCKSSSPTYVSHSSTANFTNAFSPPIQLPTMRTPRLYRTRSGRLATAAELRWRQEREEELFDAVLEGIVVGEIPGEPPVQRSIVMSLDEAGRWRIVSICEPWGP
jgi:hypothetical protein